MRGSTKMNKIILLLILAGAANAPGNANAKSYIFGDENPNKKKVVEQVAPEHDENRPSLKQEDDNSQTFAELVVEQTADAAISSKILTRLALEKDMPSRWVSVNTTRRTVTLTGFLENNEQIDRIIYIARSTEGVKKVVNYITVGEPSTTSLFKDTVITSKIKAEFVRNPNIDALTTQVETNNGVVYLYGMAETATGKLEAHDVARSVEGVVKVVNKIKILQRLK